MWYSVFTYACKNVSKQNKKRCRMVRKIVIVQLNVHYPSSKSHIVDECIDVGGAKVEKRQECLSEE